MSAKKKPPRKKTGRKWFDGKPEAEILTKLEEAWGWGCPDTEAAFHAGITAMSLFRYQKAHPSVALRKAALLERPLLLARKAIVGAFDGHKFKKHNIATGEEVEVTAPVDPEVALKYAERKAKKEFSPRVESTGADGAPLTPAQVVHIFIPHNERDPLPKPPAKPKAP